MNASRNRRARSAGIVVIGYSGADEAIAQALRARQSRYGLWWVARGAPGQPATELVEAGAGRIIVRDTAADFLADLDRRLAVFEEHPSGLTPAIVHDSIRGLLQAKDGVGLDEDLRRERNWFEGNIERVAADLRPRHPNEDGAMQDAWDALRPVLERRIASLIPLSLYDQDRFAHEIEQLSRTLERRPLSDGYTIWAELSEWAVAWLGYVCGALLVRLERYESLVPLLTSTWTSRSGYTEQVVWLPGDTGPRTRRSNGFGRATMAVTRVGIPDAEPRTCGLAARALPRAVRRGRAEAEHGPVRHARVHSMRTDRSSTARSRSSSSPAIPPLSSRFDCTGTRGSASGSPQSST